MNGKTPFAYDVMDYPSGALPQANPGHLYAVGRMFGLDPAPPAKSRTLEIGCGDGVHLIGCAYIHREATFVGVDLSEVAIARGKRLIERLGLTNVTLHKADVTTWEPPPEPFDYAIAHGFFSWVPAPVREALLSLYARVLTKNGLGYISYNTYPGCYIRRMVWEILKSPTVGVSDPREKLAKALGMARFLQAGATVKGEYGQELFLAELNDVINGRSPEIVYHDDLGAVNEPMYFTEFAAHAGQHGLRFVAESEAYTMETAGYPDAVRETLNAMAEKDVIAREQHIDFLRLRRFRQSILSLTQETIRSRPVPERLKDLFVAGHSTTEPAIPDLSAGVQVAFKSGESTVRTDLPIGKAGLVLLEEHWPDRLPFSELVVRAAAKLGRDAEAGEEDTLAEFLAMVWMRSVVQLHAHRPQFTREASERPVASPLARLQAHDGLFLISLLHLTVQVGDAPIRVLVGLLDGTRNREQLTAELASAFPPDQLPPPEILRKGIDQNLHRLAQAGILER
jgi:methyltransferase-like protein/ubiquinone/menaquinone biosynthesis C-methylase UbiE